MQWGISFKISATHESDLWGLPPPSHMWRLKRGDGKETIIIFYHFLYSPQSWKEWQRVASIKVQIANYLQYAKFEEYERNEVTGKVYTISDLGRYFKDFVKYPQPQFPRMEREAYRMLCRHAKRLHYEGKLHIEQLIATSIRFNVVKGNEEGIGQSVKRAISAYKFALENLDDWNIRLLPNELKEAHQKGADKTNGIKREKASPKIQEAKSLRAEGLQLVQVAERVGVSLSTVKRWLK